MKEYTKTRYHDNFAFYKNDEIIGASLREYGEYAQIEINFLLDVIDVIIGDPVVVYDVGSNIGYHATAFASRNTEVYCFEPNPLNFDILKDNTKHLNNVHLNQVAVSNQNGTTLVETFDLNDIRNFGEIHINAKEGISVPTIRLDDANLPKPHVIKVDVEGFEHGVLLGAENIIKTQQPLIYYEAQDMRDFDKSWFFLTRLGYRLYWAIIKNYNENNLNKNPNSIFGDSAIFDVIALPPAMGYLKDGIKVLGPDDHWNRLLKKD